MKKTICIVYTLYLVMLSVMLAFAENTESGYPAELYFVDGDMLRLISVDCVLEERTVQKQAEDVISSLIDGRDYNKKIKRLIPNIKNCMSVKVSGNTAYVNILKSSIEWFPDGRACEALVVYQIVNSLTSIDGIDKVKFTIDESTEKRFKGFIDMRETFIPDYYV